MSENIVPILAALGVASAVAAGVGVAIWTRRRRRAKGLDALLDAAEANLRGPEQLEHCAQLASLRKALEPLSDETNQHLRDLYRSAVATVLEDRRVTPIESEWLRGLAAALAVSARDVAAAHREAFIDVLESAIADSRITMEEDQWVNEVRAKLEVPAEQVGKELALVDQLKRAAAVNAQPLARVETSIRLQRGETAFFVGPAAELKRVIARTVQRQGVRHSDFEYERQDEGQLVATNLRVLFVGQGSRTIRLEKVHRLEANVPDQRLMLSVVGRATPLVFGLADAAVAGTIISRLSKELENA